VTKYDSTERARDEPDCEGGVGKQDRNQRVLRREEELVEDDPGDGAVEEEIVPLDGGSDQARDNNTPEIAIGNCSSCYCVPAPFLLRI
jgi:hypothetical protein